MHKTTINFSLFIFLLFNVCFAQQSSNLSIDTGMVSYYTFDSLSFQDSIGSNHWQTTNSFTNLSTSTDRFNNSNGALYANSPAYRTLNSSNWPSGTSDRSFSIWYNINLLPQRGLSNLRFLFFQGAQTNGNGMGLAIGRHEIYFISYLDDFSVSNNLTISQWSHLVGTYDGDTVKLYHNGQLIGTSSKSWNTIGTNVNLMHFTKVSGVYNNKFSGSIDDFRIYDRILTPQEVQTLYNRTVVSVEEKLEEKGSYALYPNPSDGKIFLESDVLEVEEVKIYNMRGKLIEQTLSTELESGIDLSDLKPGVYFASFVESGIMRKFILK